MFIIFNFLHTKKHLSYEGATIAAVVSGIFIWFILGALAMSVIMLFSGDNSFLRVIRFGTVSSMLACVTFRTIQLVKCSCEEPLK